MTYWIYSNYNILMALINKIINETWVRARRLGVLFSVHSDICFLGAGSYIKGGEWCGCIVWAMLAITSCTDRNYCVASDSRPWNLFRAAALIALTMQTFKQQNNDSFIIAWSMLICNLSKHDGGVLLYNVTAITPCDVTWDWKQSLKRLHALLKRWPDQTHCDLCAHVFLASPLGLVESRSEAQPWLCSYSRASTIYVGWQRGICFHQIPLLLNFCLLSLTLSPNPHKTPATGHKYL